MEESVTEKENIGHYDGDSDLELDTENNNDAEFVPFKNFMDEDADEKYEQELREKHKEILLETQVTNTKKQKVLEFQSELEVFEKTYCIHRLDSKSDVLKFWKLKSTKFPLLSKVAQIVLAAVATQVSVERLFSHLKFILSDSRNKLSSSNVKNILLVPANFEQLDNKFFQKVVLNIFK